MLIITNVENSKTMKETKTSVVEENNDTKPADNQNVENNTADTGNVNPDNVPYARFNEVTKQNKALQEQINKENEKREADRVKRMEEEGKTQELYAESQIKLKSLEEKVAHYEAVEQQERETLLGQLPEEDREVYGKLPTPDLKKHMSKVSQTAVSTDKSAPVRGTNLKVKDTNEIWDMSDNNKRKNWSDIVNYYKKK